MSENTRVCVEGVVYVIIVFPTSPSHFKSRKHRSSKRERKEGGEVSKVTCLSTCFLFLWDKKGEKIDQAMIVHHMFVL